MNDFFNTNNTDLNNLFGDDTGFGFTHVEAAPTIPPDEIAPTIIERLDKLAVVPRENTLAIAIAALYIVQRTDLCITSYLDLMKSLFKSLDYPEDDVYPAMNCAIMLTDGIFDGDDNAAAFINVATVLDEHYNPDIYDDYCYGLTEAVRSRLDDLPDYIRYEDSLRNAAVLLACIKYGKRLKAGYEADVIISRATFEDMIYPITYANDLVEEAELVNGFSDLSPFMKSAKMMEIIEGYASGNEYDEEPEEEEDIDEFLDSLDIDEFFVDEEDL